MSSFLPNSVPGYIIRPLVNLLIKLRVTPNAITITGVFGNMAAAVFVGFDYLLIGGIIILLSSALDVLDGALARATNTTSKFGGILDSVMDRVSEAAVLLGLLILFSQQGGQTEVVLIFLALFGSIMVSYTRARSELSGIDMKDGYFTRAERVILLAIGLIIEGIFSEGLTVTLWILAVASNLTASQRLFLSWRRSKN